MRWKEDIEEKKRMAGEDAAEATLELTLLSADLLKKPKPSPSFLLSRSSSHPSSSSFAVAWIDPSVKRSTKTLDHTLLHFPLPPSVLRNPSSLLTIQILSSRVPFASPKLVGAATLPLSSFRIGHRGDVRTLQLLKPSGRCRGTVRIVARILWCLGEMPDPLDTPSGACPTRPPPPPPPRPPMDLPYIFDPSAPLMPEEVSICPDSMNVNSSAPMEGDESGNRDCPSVDLRDMDTSTMDDSTEQSVPTNMQLKHEGHVNEDGHKDGAWRSFLVGLASGTVAIVLMGAAAFSEG